jgi:D-alanyl-lipoteichoic acid acyltransferase DltB (MBOAT superfamily)
VSQFLRNFFIYVLYLVFFPKLLSGPIERESDLIPQLQDPPQFDYLRFAASHPVWIFQEAGDRRSARV